MSRGRGISALISRIGISITALIALCPAVSAEESAVLTYDNRAFELQFYDNSPYAQVSRIRSLSLLTLTNSGKSRWFVGVNSNGIFGLHYQPTASYKRDAKANRLRQQYVDRYRVLDTY